METGYVEAAPLGPTSNGDVGGDDAITDSWSRRFVRRAFGDKGYAVVEVDCYLWQRGAGGHDPADPSAAPLGPVQLVQQTTYTFADIKDDPGGSERYCETVYQVLVDATEDRPLTHADSYRACLEVDPADITWSGLPRSELPCNIHQPHERNAACLVHSTVDLLKIGGAWSCDLGHRWRFVIRRGKYGPVLGELSMLMMWVVGSIGVADPLVVRLLVDDDTLEPLVVRQVDAPDSTYAVYAVVGIDNTEYTRVRHLP